MQDQHSQQRTPDDRESKELLSILDRITRKMGGKSKMIQFARDHKPCINAVSTQNANARTVLRCVDGALEHLKLPPDICESLKILQIKSPLVEEQSVQEEFPPLLAEPKSRFCTADDTGKSPSNEFRLHEDILDELLSDFEHAFDDGGCTSSNQSSSDFGLSTKNQVSSHIRSVCSTGADVDMVDQGEPSSRISKHDPSVMDVFNIDDSLWDEEDLDYLMNIDSHWKDT